MGLGIGGQSGAPRKEQQADSGFKIPGGGFQPKPFNFNGFQAAKPKTETEVHFQYKKIVVPDSNKSAQQIARNSDPLRQEGKARTEIEVAKAKESAPPNFGGSGPVLGMVALTPEEIEQIFKEAENFLEFSTHSLSTVETTTEIVIKPLAINLPVVLDNLQRVAQWYNASNVNNVIGPSFNVDGKELSELVTDMKALGNLIGRIQNIIKEHALDGVSTGTLIKILGKRLAAAVPAAATEAAPALGLLIPLAGVGVQFLKDPTDKEQERLKFFESNYYMQR